MIRLNLHDGEREALVSLAQDVYAHRRARERAQMVLLVDSGWTRAAIGAMLGRSSRTVEEHVRRYARGGLEELASWKHKALRPGTPARERRWYGPILEGLLGGERLWTVEALREAIARETGRRPSGGEMRGLLTFGKGRHGHDA